MTAKQIKKKFESRIRGLLKPFGDVDETSDEEFSWSVFLQDMEIRVTISERTVREDDEVGFALSGTCVGENGEILSDCTPYNYSPELWTTDMNKLEHRFQILEDWAEHLIERFGRPADVSR